MVEPTCALDSDGTFVVAYRESTLNGGLPYMWISTGTVNTVSKKIDHMLELRHGPPQKMGSNAALAMFAGTVVMVFENRDYDTDCNCSTGLGNLMYTVGTLEDLAGGFKGVAWGPTEVRFTGRDPTCAMSGNTIVVAHEGRDKDELYYRAGTVALGSITWSRPRMYAFGRHPALAMYEDTILEVHQGQSRDALWHRVGKLDSNLEIQWTSWPTDSISTGVEPTCAMNDKYVVEAHKSDRRDELFYRRGTLL